MKQQCAFRLVQRKFAQGVPVPVNSAAASPAPERERKPDPPGPPRNVYHNNMTAKNLLDHVAMQHIHKHKKRQQPRVLLERLREDTIKPDSASSLKIPFKKRRQANKNNMCLRSGKNKTAHTAKVAAKKRKKLTSESTDDIPLVYYFSTSSASKQPQDSHADKDKKSPSSKRVEQEDQEESTSRRADRELMRLDSTDRSEDGSFTFKEPSSPLRLSYRLYKKTLTSATGRPLRKAGRPKSDARWSGLRSARTSTETPGVRGVPSRLRNKGKKLKKPASKKSGEPPPSPQPEVSGLDNGPAIRPKSSLSECSEPPPSPQPGTSGLSYGPPFRPHPPPSETSEPPLSPLSGVSGLGYEPLIIPKSPPIKSPEPPSPSPSPQPGPSGLSDGPSMIRKRSYSDAKNTPEPSGVPDGADAILGPYSLTNFDFSLRTSGESDMGILDDWCIKNLAANNAQIDNNTSADVENAETVDGIVETDRTGSLNGADETAGENITQTDESEQVTEPDQDERSVDHTKVDGETVGRPKRKVNIEKQKSNDETAAKKKRGRKNNQKETAGVKKTKGKPERQPVKSTRGKGANKKKTESPARLLRHTRDSQPPAPANPDVYEFDAELEASRPPSGLRTRRNQASGDTTEPARKKDDVYFDVLPECNHCVQITPKKDVTKCPTVSLVNKEAISTQKKKALIENLASSPSLLDKFFNCLSPEIQTELDNIIAAGQASGELQPSTSQRAEPKSYRNESANYLDQKTASVLEALTFHPTAEEFADPIKYYDKIAPEASRFGLCKIVPPQGFKPPCNISDSIRFAVIYQYISKMYSRWGPVSRELAAIKAHLRTQSVVFARSPLLDGSEVNLPKLYHIVERNGGLTTVIQRKRWGRVAEEMKLGKLQHPERKLDPIYMRYLLPYATLSDQERQNLMADVESRWTTKYQKMLDRARNPFQRQSRMLGESESSDDENEESSTAGALHEAEDCIVQGRTMNLATFKKIATSLMETHFEHTKLPPSSAEVEKAYWRVVMLGTEHIVANTASIDTGEEGYGFPKDPDAEYGSNPWNLKVLARNPGNVLRYLGPVLGVTVPTLHLNMIFSTSCWHRDPHGLPWVEYSHEGAEKIWYGIPREESANFRRAVETLCPAYCQNKSIWLASEITMIPPNILGDHGVGLSRLVQRPGEYVLVFPEAHSCSITSGFGISESVYFASNTWLSSVYKLFQELRNSCEPTMFSLEQLLLNGSKDEAAPPQVCSVLYTLLAGELEYRNALESKGLKVQERPPSNAPLNTSYFRAWNTRDQDECEYCRSTLYLSKVTGLTGRKTAVCPEHALRLLETKKYRNIDLSTLEFVSSYSTSAIEEMLERLETPSNMADDSAVDEVPADDDPIEVIDLTDRATPAN